MAEVHLIGHILEATDFTEDRSLFIKWAIQAGSCWRPIEGFTEGQTQLILGVEKPAWQRFGYYDDLALGDEQPEERETILKI